MRCAVTEAVPVEVAGFDANQVLLVTDPRIAASGWDVDEEQYVVAAER